MYNSLCSFLQLKVKFNEMVPKCLNVNADKAVSLLSLVAVSLKTSPPPSISFDLAPAVQPVAGRIRSLGQQTLGLETFLLLIQRLSSDLAPVTMGLSYKSAWIREEIAFLGSNIDQSTYERLLCSGQHLPLGAELL